MAESGANETVLLDEKSIKSEAEDEVKSEMEHGDYFENESYTSDYNIQSEAAMVAVVSKIKLEDEFNYDGIEESVDLFSFDAEDENLSGKPLNESLDSKENQPSNKSSKLSKPLGTKRKYKKRKTLISEAENSSFPLGEGLKYYKMIILAENPGRCNICFKVFQNYILLRDHQKEVHQVDPIVFCEACSIPCSSKKVYDIHRRAAHKDFKFSQMHLKEIEMKGFKCRICKIKMKSQTLLQRHMMSEHLDLEKEVDGKYKKDSSNIRNKQRCEICKEYYVSLLPHQIKAHGFKKPNKNYNCSLCKITFRRRKTFNAHRLSAMHKASLRKLKLTNSSDEINNKSDVKHEGSLRDNNEEVKDSSKANRKYRRVDEEGSFVMQDNFEDVSRKYFDDENNKTNLLKPRIDVRSTESKAHKKEVVKKLYTCPWCDKIFRLLDHLFDHANTHEESKNNPCEHCGKLFSTFSTKWKHKLLCGDEVLCNECGKLFRGSRNLKEHIKRYHTEKSFICELCGKNCKSESTFRHHLQGHRDENVDKEKFKCKECGKILKHSLSLQKHLRRVHYGAESKRLLHCPICGKTTKNTTNMKIHQRIHEPNRDLKRRKKEDNSEHPCINISV